MNRKPRILLIEEDRGVIKLIAAQFAAVEWEVHTESDGYRAQQFLEKNAVDFVLTELVLTSIGGAELIEWYCKRKNAAPVVVMTSNPSIEMAVNAMKAGAEDLLLKPVEYKTIHDLVQRVHSRWLQQNSANMVHAFSNNDELSKLYRAVIDKIAQTPTTVLIQGESGTGKELMSNLIHFHSNRRDKPYIKVSCASLPETLMESELFGHEAGAFTGATKARKGRFELADTGTIFLDEIGDLPLTVQTKLLRVLQERTIERLGSEKSIKVDVRIVAATWRDLAEEVKAGRFREDLFYRLNVIKIQLPPLRKRVGDIEELAKKFVERFRLRSGKPSMILLPETVEALKRYDWPGNIRELENVMERAVVMASSDIIVPDDLGDKFVSSETVSTDEDTVSIPSLKDARRHFEREFIVRVLRKCDGNLSVAAEMMRIARKNLYEKIDQLGIDLNGLRDLPEVPEAPTRVDFTVV